MPCRGSKSAAGLKGLLIGLCLSPLPGSTTLAHSEPPPPPPKPPPKIHVKPVPRVYPLRWSWLHWWEANRDLYLTRLMQDREQTDDPDQVAAGRAEAVGALLQGLGDPEAEPRAACALALGRMRETSAVEPLIGLVENDPNQKVRFYALLAIGIIGSEQSEAFLIEHTYPSDFLRTAGTLGLGYLVEPSPETLSNLEDLVQARNERPSMADATAWALRQHPGDGTTEGFKSVLSTRPSPWLAVEAIRALGAAGDAQVDRLLIEMVRQGPRARRMPAWRLLDEVRDEKIKAIGRRASGQVPMTGDLSRQQKGSYTRWLNAHRRLFNLAPTPLRFGEPPPDYKGTKMIRGIEEIYLARLRATAAIALADVGGDDAVHALRQLVREKDDDYNIVPRCFAAISLGQIGSPESLPDLMALVEPRTGRRAKTQEELESPLRGFAAIALGLYARPYDSPQGQADRLDYDKAIDLLFERLMDRKEKQELRNACAVALGLTRRTVNLKPLITFNEKLEKDDTLLIGYVLLARAMLGDTNLVKPVQIVLAWKPHRDQTTDMLARRAAVLSLGVVGRRDVVPTLTRAWHESHYVNREVILALSLCGAVGVSEQVLPLLNDSENLYERAFMATILGELYVAERPPPLSRFLIGSNFTMKNGLKRPYRTLANEFLFDYLVELFEEDWY